MSDVKSYHFFGLLLCSVVILAGETSSQQHNVTDSHIVGAVQARHGRSLVWLRCLYLLREHALKSRLNAFCSGCVFLNMKSPAKSARHKETGPYKAGCSVFIVFYRRSNPKQRRPRKIPGTVLEIRPGARKKSFRFTSTRKAPQLRGRCSFHKVFAKSPDNAGGKVQYKKDNPINHWLRPPGVNVPSWLKYIPACAW